MMEKRDSPSQKLSVTIRVQVFVTTLLLDVINEWSHFTCLCRKVFTVNKLILIYFTWFVYTFVNCKYNVLLKRDNVFLMPLSTFVTLTRFDYRKEKKWPINPMHNVLVTLQQHCCNIGQQRCHNIGNWRWYHSHFRPCHNVASAWMDQ